MTRRMQQLIAAVILAAATIAVVVATRPPRPTQDDRPICHPDDTWAPISPGWPAWNVCGDSHRFHTCWRPQGHTGRHTEWDLSTTQVTAVWPCEDTRQ